MNGAFGRGDWIANGILLAAYHLNVPWTIPVNLLDTFFISIRRAVSKRLDRDRGAQFPVFVLCSAGSLARPVRRRTVNSPTTREFPPTRILALVVIGLLTLGSRLPSFAPDAW